jgi:hypothetical protein
VNNLQIRKGNKEKYYFTTSFCKRFYKKYSKNKSNRGDEQTSFIFRVSEIAILSESDGKMIDHISFVLKQ